MELEAKFNPEVAKKVAENVEKIKLGYGNTKKASQNSEHIGKNENSQHGENNEPLPDKKDP